MAVRNISEAKPKKKRFRKVHFLWVILIIGAVVFVFASLAQNFIELGQIKDEINEINQEITELDKNSAQIQEILDDKTHEEYFEKIAREEYGYCKPGEKVYYNSSFGE